MSWTPTFWHVIRGESPTPGMTIAKRHAPYARSLDARGRGLVHLVDRVVVVWTPPEAPTLGGRWACSSQGGSQRIELLHEPPEGSMCAACLQITNASALGAPADRRSVYYARRGDVIKIGVSGNPGRRIASFKGDVVGVEPGGYDVERLRHHQFRHLRVAGEWFKADPELLRHIDALQAAS